MTVDTEPRRSRRGILTVVLGGVIAGVAAVIVARLRKQNDTHITMNISIDRPVDEVFSFVSDSRNVLEWLPSAAERRKVTDGPIGVGTRFEATDHIAGREVEHTQETIDFEQDRLVKWQVSAPWDGTYEIRVEPADEGTLLSVDTTFHPSGLFRLLGLVPASLMRQQLEQDYGRLKGLLEGRAEPLARFDDETEAESDIAKPPATIAIDPEGESVGAAPKETAAT